jgi:hypothetical protein
MDGSMTEELMQLVQAYCLSRNLILESYVEGLISSPGLDDATTQTLIRYHREWLKG